jgi:hypothetical protein
LAVLLLASSTATYGAKGTVVDMSKEWNAHASSSAVAVPKVSEKNAPPSVTLEETACACEPMKAQESLAESTYAFTGFVEEATAPKKEKRAITFAVDEIFKGSPKPEMKVNVEVKNDGCDLPFQVGQSYLVFVKWEWGQNYTHRCMGTKRLAKARPDALGPSEQLKEKLYIRLRNACMGRRDTACCLSSLKAMRKGYYVPEPENGCPSGTQPDRLRCWGSYTWCIPDTEERFQSSGP